MGSVKYQHGSCKNLLGYISYLNRLLHCQKFCTRVDFKDNISSDFFVFLGIFFTAEMEGTYQWMLVFFMCVITLPTLLSEKCFSRGQKTHLYLATKSPYRYLANKNDSAVNYPGETFTFVFLIFPVISKLVTHILLLFLCYRL
jgi:hypothetical protein